MSCFFAEENTHKVIIFSIRPEQFFAVDEVDNFKNKLVMNGLVSEVYNVDVKIRELRESECVRLSIES
jgi:hypothetical protein